MGNRYGIARSVKPLYALGAADSKAGKVVKLYSCSFSYLRDRVCFIFSGAGKFCFAHGLRQLTCDVKSDDRTLNFRSDVTYVRPQKATNDIRRRSFCDIKCQK